MHVEVSHNCFALLQLCIQYVYCEMMYETDKQEQQSM